MKDKLISDEQQTLLDVKNFGEPVDLLEQRDQAYNERNRVVAFLARLCHVISTPDNLFGAGLAIDPNEEPGWQTVVFIDTPNGQLSWHIPGHERSLFHNLCLYTGKWDGHSTEEKNRRLNENLSDWDCAGQAPTKPQRKDRRG